MEPCISAWVYIKLNALTEHSNTVNISYIMDMSNFMNMYCTEVFYLSFKAEVIKADSMHR